METAKRWKPLSTGSLPEASVISIMQKIFTTDIVLSPMNPKEPAVILEFKLAEKFTQMEAKCAEALEQIDRLHYNADLIDMGYQTILKYGICFCRKTVWYGKNRKNRV